MLAQIHRTQFLSLINSPLLWFLVGFKSSWITNEKWQQCKVNISFSTSHSNVSCLNGALVSTDCTELNLMSSLWSVLIQERGLYKAFFSANAAKKNCSILLNNQKNSELKKIYIRAKGKTKCTAENNDVGKGEERLGINSFNFDSTIGRPSYDN